MAAHFDARTILSGGKRAAPAPDASVVCDTCDACCRKECVMLTEREDHRLYDTVPITNPLTGRPGHMLKHHDDGACIYLGESGCTIYDRRPEICRAFTCVGWVNRIMEETSRAVRRRDMKAGLIDREVWEAGMARRNEAEVA